VRSYLALVGLHFDDRLTVRESIDPHVLDNEIPSMVLQLLVENAIKHGVVKHDRGSILDLCIARKDSRVKIEVINDGVLKSRGDGAGLSNLRQRCS